MRKAPLIFMFVIVLSWLAIGGVQSTSAATFIEGHITTDTTWRAADAPYILSKDVFVDEGVTLTIEPNVEVRFGGNFRIEVIGNFKAVGTNGNEIIFTSNKVNPEAGDWNTIEFIGADEASFEMTHCVVQYATHGVTINGLGRSEVKSCEFTYNSESGVLAIGEGNSLIKGNVLKLNKYGISIEGEYATGFSVVNNEIHNNSNDGVWTSVTDDIYNLTISNNTISFNEDNGVDISASGEVYNLAISNNTISFNEDNGVDISASGEVYNLAISNNTISFNEDNGVDISASDDVYNLTISNNTISFNEYTGVYISAYGDVYNLTISNNTISSIEGNGVDIYASDDVYNLAISNNTISSNEGNGVDISASDDVYNLTISSNIVVQNTYAGIYIGGGAFYSSSRAYEVWITSNVISANSDGIINRRSCRVNITGNSIFNNTAKGIYLSSKGNAAHFNNIYGNKYGMYVGRATVNAEKNYWGDPSGPYHESLNPWGTGDPVNGDGTDLDFIPFLTSPFGAGGGDPTPQKGAIAVTSEPSEAKIILEGFSSSSVKAPYTFSNIPVGVHTIKLSLDGY